MEKLASSSENNLPSFGSMRILEYIACNISFYQCDKYTCLDIHTRAGVLVVEKDHGSGVNDQNRLVRLLLGSQP